MWSLGFLVPHAPILVPQVASLSRASCGKTVSAFRSVGRSLKGIRPDFLLVLDPHASTGSSFTIIHAEKFTGNLAEFGARTASAVVEGAGEEGKALSLHLNSIFPVLEHREKVFSLDYAAVVSLVFLQLALGYIPPMILANPVTLSYKQSFDLGCHLRTFSSKTGWALLASGDLSHCLNDEGPGGYHPDAEVLDRTILESLEMSSPFPVFSLPAVTIQNAGECGLRSALCLIGLSGGSGIEVLSYEAPFGVGYATALWKGGMS
ncbi:MAG: class III extradiol dioxygenase subunit B-like domain-containing protein [Thermovirgaceae bacterium]|nr:class III extradiol dioxygenase subunit B-like domain-containing protein [Thermovirgaceae bacterium]